MKTKALALILFLIVSSTLLSAASLSWESTRVDLLMEPDQEEARATFVATNEGTEVLRIARIGSSCGCTGSVVSKRIIEPGESTEIVGVFSKGRRQGLNRNRLQVFLDNQAEPAATLHMNVQIPTLMEASPQIVYWTPQSSNTARTVRINLDERYINEISKIQYDRGKILVTHKKVSDQGERVHTLLIEPVSYSESYRGTIVVSGTGPKGRQSEARLHAIVQP